jgi:hypothetical protein
MKNLSYSYICMHKTRLEQLLKIKAKHLLFYLQNNRSFFYLKIFTILLGFFTANMLATILGQTGDWDVLVASILTVIIEYIGFLIYKKPGKKFYFILDRKRRQKSFFLVNIWKIGFIYGLFVDSFKVGS